jgi:glutamyl/glutaminyl-tRNA synthetase
VEGWATASLEEVLRDALVERLEVSPRHAFGPLRVAISGRRVSPPLFESMEVLGRSSSLQRLGELCDNRCRRALEYRGSRRRKLRLGGVWCNWQHG